MKSLVSSCKDVQLHCIALFKTAADIIKVLRAYLCHEVEERVLVLEPVHPHVLLRRVLVTAQLQRQFQAVGRVVVVVLTTHNTTHNLHVTCRQQPRAGRDKTTRVNWRDFSSPRRLRDME